MSYCNNGFETCSDMLGAPLSFKSSLLLKAHEDARTTAAQQRLPSKLIKMGVIMSMATSDGVARNIRKEVAGGMVRCLREESREARGSASMMVTGGIRLMARQASQETSERPTHRRGTCNKKH